MPENKLKIAIVDDHALFRKSLTVLINLFPNCSVIFDAANGEELIARLNPGTMPDIVLMDINMPLMDGYQTTAWLRDNHPAVNVIALSTMDAEAAIIKMIREGARGYVLKDAEPAELRVAFGEVMSRGYFYNEHISHKILRSVHQLTEPQNKVGVFAKLSERETEFLKLACTELTYKEIADKLFVSVRTVEGYRDTLCEKLNLKTRVGLAMYAVKNGLVTV
ncbi:response regulator [Mucilaginibacter pedocola]|uniref:DNA-binding response regulator n=1 Tax=Mucilaginibacter pedocola TaxID=1792845 RepID=A0A1S9PAJ8_9SPHI|nr:response regulator transcription factor [Mucilaginibacter pedocola]OOQ57975.1 DNA-binding response regulator [Mucilaginibacter pedocola]